MKSFKDYLTESKKIYEFKIKIAGPVPKDFDKALKLSLAKFNVESVSKAKSTPIQESPFDFPNVKHQEVTVFNVTLTYPTNSPIVKSAVAQMANVDESRVLVRTNGEEAESLMNAEGMREGDGNALLGTEYENADNQDLVGEKHKLSFLKELGKTKHGLEEVTIDSPLNVKAKASKGQK